MKQNHTQLSWRNAVVLLGMTIVMLCFTFVLTPTSAAYANDSSFYTGATDAGMVHNTEPVVPGNGMTYSMYFADQNGATSNYAASGDFANSITRPTKSIVDIDVMTQLFGVVEIQNNTDKAYNFGANDYLMLPLYNEVWHPNTNLLDVESAPQVTTTSNASKVTFSFIGTSVRVDGKNASEVASAYEQAGGVWKDLKQISLTGTLQPGEKVTIKIPFVLNDRFHLNEEKYLYGSSWQGMKFKTALDHAPWNGGAIEIQIRPARQMKMTDAAGNTWGVLEKPGKYAAATLNTDGTYTLIPDEYQKLAADMSLSDIHIINMLYIDRHSATVDSRCYTGSWYTIDTRSLRASLRDVGYSVHPGDSERYYFDDPRWVMSIDEDKFDDLVQEYRYQTTGHAELTNPPSGDALGSFFSNLYEEVRQVVETKDLTLRVGDSYAPADSFVSMVDHAGDTVALDDAKHVRVVSDVDTSKPGVYHTRYYYYFNGNAAAAGDDYEASKEATITVTGSYTVTFDAQSGEGAPEALSGDMSAESTDVTIPDTVPTREGYTFEGWNTVADGSGGTYAAGDTLNVSYSDPNVTLYAQWKEVAAPKQHEYVVNYDANGGVNAPAQVHETSTDTSFNVTLSKDVPVREGYTFEGWNTAKDGSGAMYQPGATLKLAADASEVTLYAQWENIDDARISTSGDEGNNGSDNEVYEPSTSPKTGDTMMLGAFAAVILMSGVIVLAALYNRRQER